MNAWVCGCVCALLVANAGEPRGARPSGSREPAQASPCLEVPAHAFDVVLARPTSDSITASVLCYEDAEGCIAYGPRADALAESTPPRVFRKGEPAEVRLSPLRPDTRYFYQLRLKGTNSAVLGFHTARPAGSAFTFTLTADSHLDAQTDPAVYQATLAAALREAPDFHVDLGDTFMTEKHARRDDALRQYLAQRYYLSQLGDAAPLFFVLGNHDGEFPGGGGRDPAGLAVWSAAMRQRYFPNPIPDAFYTGNATPQAGVGLLQDFYAWTWGDALFVVLDPFWFTPRQRGRSDNWSRTLGAEQYRWLQRTLEASRARFKFVFIHNLVGGLDNQGRGGVEVAPYYEWGGKNADGTDGFEQHRPGWPMPIHPLLVLHKVNVVFHGHDHFYARQELDGVVYQEVPQPGHPAGSRLPPFAAEYGYAQGVLLGGSGYLAVEVSPAEVRVAYRRTSPSGSQVADSYNLR